MTYNVFGGTLSLTQAINIQIRWNRMSLQLLDLHELDCIVEAVCTG